MFAYRVTEIKLNKDGSVNEYKDFIKGSFFSTEGIENKAVPAVGHLVVEELKLSLARSWKDSY